MTRRVWQQLRRLQGMRGHYPKLQAALEGMEPGAAMEFARFVQSLEDEIQANAKAEARRMVTSGRAF